MKFYYNIDDLYMYSNSLEDILATYGVSLEELSRELAEVRRLVFRAAVGAEMFKRAVPPTDDNSHD